MQSDAPLELRTEFSNWKFKSRQKLNPTTQMKTNWVFQRIVRFLCSAIFSPQPNKCVSNLSTMLPGVWVTPDSKPGACLDPICPPPPKLVPLLTSGALPAPCSLCKSNPRALLALNLTALPRSHLLRNGYGPSNKTNRARPITTFRLPGTSAAPSTYRHWKRASIFSFDATISSAPVFQNLLMAPFNKSTRGISH